MTSPSVPERNIEIFFASADRTVILEMTDEDPHVADMIVAALASEDPDETETRLRDAVGASGVVRRRP